MPYNNSPIAPSEEVTGTTSLPLARVKKIIAADPDTGSCSNNAAFAIAIAGQLFVQHLVEQTHNVVKSERRPRRNIQYKDVANAVSRIDNLEFLADVVPRTTTFGKFKEKKMKEDAAKSNELPPNGQRLYEPATKLEDEDEEIDDMNQSVSAINGAKGSHEELGTQSSTSARPSAHARHNFDAVRNGFYEEPELTIPMGE